MDATDYTTRTVELFAALPFLNIKEVAKIMETDYGNLHNQVKGNKPVSEKRFRQIMEALRKIKEQIPTE